MCSLRSSLNSIGYVSDRHYGPGGRNLGRKQSRARGGRTSVGRSSKFKVRWRSSWQKGSRRKYGSHSLTLAFHGPLRSDMSRSKRNRPRRLTWKTATARRLSSTWPQKTTTWIGSAALHALARRRTVVESTPSRRSKPASYNTSPLQS